MKATATTVIMLLFFVIPDTLIAQPGMRGPHLLIYKTKTNCRHMVPVIMSADKQLIVSYPAPSDLSDYRKIEPDKLKKGYLLDNRGIGTNVAFLNVSYKQYARMSAAPTIAEMSKMIADRNPLTELWDCGLRSDFDSPRADVNRIIRLGQLATKCKQVPLKKP